VKRLEQALVRIGSDLRQLSARAALIGGLAVSIRAEPRTTRDVDLAVAVESDREAESLVRALLGLQYRIAGQLEQDRAGRLATVRLLLPDAPRSRIVIDLLFASSGIEREIVEAADELEVLPGVTMPVATAAHLLALKVLAGRAQDVVDAQSLLSVVDATDLEDARAALDLIRRRGFDRGRPLEEELDELLDRHRRDRGEPEG
jgi:hypothetical protein